MLVMKQLVTSLVITVQLGIRVTDCISCMACYTDVPWNTSIDEKNVYYNGTIPSYVTGKYHQNGPAIWNYLPFDDNPTLFWLMYNFRNAKVLVKF